MRQVGSVETVLDERYGCSVSSSRKCFMGETPLRPNECCYIQHLAGRFLFSSRSWSLTASSSTGPQRRNRWRAVAPEDFATPGTDRVRQEVATPGLQIPLEQQYGDLLLASAQKCFRAFDIVAIQFLKVEALRAEYQNPLMEH